MLKVAKSVQLGCETRILLILIYWLIQRFVKQNQVVKVLIVDFVVLYNLTQLVLTICLLFSISVS